MRRLYVCSYDHMQHHRSLFPSHLTTHWLALCPSSSPADLAAWEAAGKPITLSTEFQYESPELTWSEHPGTFVLPHPVWHGNSPITLAHSLPENTGVRLDGVRHLVRSSHGIQATHTVLHTHAALARVHPAFKLRALR